MIHITRAKGGYMVVTLAKNKKVLSTSEMLKTKRSAFTNIASQLKLFRQHHVNGQDDTGVKPIRLLVYSDGSSLVLNEKPVKPYVAKKKR